jgi:hypothetical protein
MDATKCRALTCLVAVCLATTALPEWSRADDQGVVGLKLIMIDKYMAAGKAKVAFVSHDPTAGAIHNGSGSGNPADLSGTVQICPTAAPANAAVYALPSPWAANLPTVAKYKNTLAAAGGAGAKVLVVKPTSTLKVVAKNLGDGDAASGDQSATDLNLNDPPGTCTVAAGDGIEVEVTINDVAGGPATHRLCAHFVVDAAVPIAGGTGCKVKSLTSAAGICNVCGGGTSTSTTIATTTTTSTIPPPVPPCGIAGAPLCDGFCPSPIESCIDLGGFCGCVPSGIPCGLMAGAPLCWGVCPPFMACKFLGMCVCSP